MLTLPAVLEIALKKLKQQYLTRKREKIKAGPVNAVRSIANAAAFLAMIGEGWSIKASCAEIGCSRSAMYKWLREDEGFRESFANAYEDGTDTMEDEAVRRAVHGTVRPIFQGGEKVGSVREYSDRLLERLLAGRRPKRYGAHPETPKDKDPMETPVLSLEDARAKAREMGLPDRVFLE